MLGFYEKYAILTIVEVPLDNGKTVTMGLLAMIFTNFSGHVWEIAYSVCNFHLTNVY